jgi:hypothetical protein
MGMIMGEFHMIPLKINNYNHMKLKAIYLIVMLALMFSCNSEKQADNKHSAQLKPHFYKTLSVLNAALVSLQNNDSSDTDYGALWCSHCNLYHTRAAEAVYPFAYEFAVSGNIEYKKAAIRLGNWLIRQQFPDGSWKETPEEWTGTSTDQLLMMQLH